jgi:hypothetical protein
MVGTLFADGLNMRLKQVFHFVNAFSALGPIKSGFGACDNGFLKPFDHHLEEMMDALNRLRGGSRSSVDPVWRTTVIESTVVLTRGVAELISSLAPAAAPRDLTDEHLQAQRYARVRVAEMALYQAAQVNAGRAARNLYGTLKTQIDEARTGFQQKFLTEARGMPDYLHGEIVLVLAHNDVSLLGPDYPGPLA